MADDDKHDDSDPWAEIESTSTPDLDGGFDFSFDDEPKADAGQVGEQPVDAESVEEPTFLSEVTGPASESADAADDDVSDWLSEAADEGEASVPSGTLGLFAGDDEPAITDAADPAAVRVGSEESGIVDEADAAGAFGSDVDQAGGGFGWDGPETESAVKPSGEPVPFGVVGSDLDERVGDALDADGADGESVESGEGWGVTDDEKGADAEEAIADGVAAIAVTGPTTNGRPVKRRARKGGLGQMIGVALGGMLALPITLAILIWGFRQDPLKLVRHVPESLAFLFPAELVRGGAPAHDGGAGGPTLDDVPAVAADGGEGTGATSDVADVAATEPLAEPVTEVAVSEPPPGTEPPMTTEETSSTAGEPMVDPLVADPSAVVASSPAEPVVPLPDPFADPTSTAPLDPAEPAVAVTASEPVVEPLDLTAIDAAVASAAEVLEAVRAVESADVDPDPIRRERMRTRLLVDWYRRLSAVAEEFAGLERVAADTGRPLSSPPDAVARLQEDVVGDPGRLADLARLSRNWMAYQGRSTSGIVMPAVLGTVRQIGPYWCATLTISEAGDRTRDVVVLSRSEPMAVVGDEVLVTGLIVDVDTLWASDVRTARVIEAATSPADEPKAVDPFAEPDTTDAGLAPDPAGDAPESDPFVTPAP